MVTVNRKRCNMCGAHRDLTQFHKKSKGYSHICKECHRVQCREYNATHREERKELRQVYNEVHRESILEDARVRAREYLKAPSVRLRCIWHNMMRRCYNPAANNYKWYGGRGIQVCHRWHDQSKFIEDNLPLYQIGLSMDRLDNNGEYSFENIEWVTKQKNSMRQQATLRQRREIDGD